MSKASEWSAAAAKLQRPTFYVEDYMTSIQHAKAQVSERGGIDMLTTTLGHDDALRLGKWILCTFGEESA